MQPHPPSKFTRLPRLPKLLRWRMSDWLLAAILLSFAIWWIAPHQLPVSLFKLNLIALAAVAGYWIDRSLFPYARPDVFLEMEGDAEPLPPLECDADSDSCTLIAEPNEALLRVMGICMLRRAIIVSATMMAVGMGA